ncbi:S-layer homology domain-containing protein [Candidatus Peregrinibacteria bacterium]|nr:S-layer homology domain-containing protein [Candidatus Peregrinibacteria bacterium]
MRKSILISLGIVSLAAFAGRAFAAGFSDTAGTEFETAFTAFQTRGIVRGYSDGLARPHLPINRAEALKIILGARGTSTKRLGWYRKHMPSISLFSDVDQKAWYGPYLEVGFEDGLITGYDDGTFRPGQYVRVEEAVAMVMRAYGIKGDAASAELSDYIENQANAWFTPAVNAIIKKNLVMHKGRLRIGTAITRGQLVDIVYRMGEVKSSKVVAYNGPEPEAAPQRVAAAIPTYTAPAQVVSTVPTGANVTPSLPGGVSPGVQQTSGITQPAVVPQGPNKVDHPYASEKYFAISIPKLGIDDLAIVHPEDPVSQEGVLAPLKLGVGHLFSYPGGGGKIMVYGHSSGYPWDVSEFTKIFRRVNELEVGEKVYVTYAGNLYMYQVSKKQAIPAKSTNDAFRDDGTGEELILFTCWPPDSVAQRYLVHAVPVETVALK